MAAYRRSSVVWEYFEIQDEENSSATCKLCHDTFSYRASVSNLMKHLRTKHSLASIVKDDEEDNDDTDADDKYNLLLEKHKLRKSPVWKYFTDEDEESMLATCNLCSERFSYRTTSANLGKHLVRKHNVVINFDVENVGEVTEVEALDDDDDDDEDEEEVNDEKIDTEDTMLNNTETKRRGKSSIAWQYFTVRNPKRRIAGCNLCGTECSYRTSVSNLMKHVKRKHNIGVHERGTDDEDGNGTTDLEGNISVVPDMMRAHRSIVWLYFKCVDPESKLSQCLVCNKLLSHSTTLTNLKKHLARKHPNVKIPGREDGSKRVLMAAGGQLFEVETAKQEAADNDEHDQTDAVEMNTVYLEDFDALEQEPPQKKRKLTKTAPKKNKKVNFSNVINAYDTSSEDEVTLRNKYARKQSDSLDHFGRYVASLLRKLPKQISNQLQSDFVKQIMNAQLTLETQSTQVTDTQSNAYSITITTDAQVENGEVNEYVTVGHDELIAK